MEDARASSCARRSARLGAQLEAADEVEHLGHGDDQERLEGHHRDWATRKEVSNDELGERLHCDQQVGESLNHPDWNEEKHRDEECEEGRPHREFHATDLIAIRAMTNDIKMTRSTMLALPGMPP